MALVTQSESSLLYRPTQPQFDLTITPIPLRNTDLTCFANSVLHSLFSIDYFLNVVSNAYAATERPFYKWLRDAAHKFRRENERSRGADTEVQTILGHIATVKAKNAGGESGMILLQSTQQDADGFLRHLMERICITELPNTSLG